MSGGRRLCQPSIFQQELGSVALEGRLNTVGPSGLLYCTGVDV